MDIEDIKAELRKKYGPLVYISKQLGLSRNAISATLGDPRHSIKTEIRIAELLGKNPYEVWGEFRFYEDGTPVKRSIRNYPSQVVPLHLRKKSAAA
ncbi:helix-turn-helix domain-containing protein [Saccharibacter sp. EH70]|nr:helix-turn-helix domain-containing protein [Saccharibacter sp. EH70]MXV35803.1 transcriptional regulator [Saccharibacter sp. EH611]MXV57924.1 transcriptional regulator [Saccharibacter sp. EH70]MXV66319.1 transcriptional regulator [Saccharibacter sp. EH60]